MPEILVAYYSYMLLRGISHVHRKDLVHCDIKPCNILVFKTQKGLNHLKLADFGLAKYVWEKETKRFRGTPIYASPESIGCGLHGRATDIWSFGCTVLEMMMGGRSIWSDNISTLDMFNQIVQGPPEIPQYVSEVGRDFLMRCFQINADERWTADMLLNHPFIKENTKGMFTAPGFERSNLIQMNNPFGSWISTEGLFSWSSPPAKQPSQCATSYQLFPEGKRPRDMILGGSSYLFRQSFAIWVEAFANDLFAFD